MLRLITITLSLLFLVACTSSSNPTPQNQAPTVTLEANVTQGEAPLTVTFTANAVDPDGDSLVFTWNFGDNTSKSGQNVETHTYTTAGLFTATVVVSDGTLSATADQGINVQAPALSTPAAPSNIQTTIEGQAVRVTWQDNSDNETGFSVYREDLDNQAVQLAALEKLADVGVNATDYLDEAVEQGASYRYAVTAFNESGASDPEEQENPVEVPPVPVITSFTATPSSITPGESSTLSWTVSNADTLSINNGVGDVKEVNTTNVSPGITATYTLTATNPAGSDSASVTVTVSADGNNSPVVEVFEFTQDSQTAPSIVMFTLRASDADSDPVSCTLDVDSDGNAEFTFADCSTTQTQQHTYDDPGTYEAVVMVDDGQGESNSTSSTSTTIIVTPAGENNPPVINNFTADPLGGQAPLTTTFSWEVSDPDGDELSCILTAEDDAVYTINDCAVNTSQVHTFETSTFVLVELRVSDGSDEVVDKFQYSVSAEAKPDLVVDDLNVTSNTVSPAAFTPGASFNLSYVIRNVGSADAGGSQTNIRLNQNPSGVTMNDQALLLGDNVTPITAQSSVQKSHNLTLPADVSPGTYYVWVIADANGSAGQENTTNDRASVMLEVQPVNSDPVINTFTVNPTSGDAPLDVTFNWNVSDPDGDPLSCTLTYGDGASENINNCLSTTSASHQYISEGSYTAVLEVNDTSNATDAASVLLTISPNPSACSNPVVIPDANLENAIRQKINKPGGDILCADMESLTTLNIDNKGIDSLVGLEHAINLRHLSFYKNQVSDIGPVANLTNLTALDFRNNQVSDISPVANLTNLIELFFVQNQVSDIGPVANLTNLELLVFSGNQVSDISPVANLTNLTAFGFPDNQVSDISPVANLTNLALLGFSGNQVSDISPVVNLINLELLEFNENQVSDIQALVNNTGLGSGDDIRIRDNLLDLSTGSDDLQNIQILVDRGANIVFSDCTNPVVIPDANLESAIRQEMNKPGGDILCADMASLTTLSADQRGIGSLVGLEHAINLRTLSFGNNQVSDISPVANLTNLRYLSFSQAQVNDIGPVANLTNLTGLYITFNQVSDISPVANLTNLTGFGFVGNQVSDISPVANLTNLTSLDFDGNQVSDISSLANLTNLERLFFSQNQVSDISPVANLTNLEWLSFPVNQVSDISPVANLTNLTELFFSQNQVSNISPVANLTNLELLEFNENQVSDIQALVNNTGLGAGDEIWMQDNLLDLSTGSNDLQNIQILIDRGASVTY